MKARHLLFGLSMLAALPLSARDIHSVKGYYNYTASQIQQDGIMRVDSKTGNKDNNWLPAVNYDGDFMASVLGVADAAKNWWRTTAYFNYQATDQNIKITKDYPVVAFKFSLPQNVTDNTDASMSAEFWWKNPYTGKNQAMGKDAGYPLNGIASNGRMDWAHIWRGKKIEASNAGIMQGRDSCFLRTDKAYNRWKSTEDGVAYTLLTKKTTAADNDTSFVIMRLPDETDGRSEFVMLINYYSIPDTAAEAAASKRLLDRKDIESVGYHIMSFGYSSIEDATAAPTAYIKWMKTFTSLSDAMGQITKANNFGDGTESVAKTQLNYSLYYAEQDLKNYSFRNEDPDNPTDEAYVAYQTAYINANAVYNNESSTEADYAAANNALQQARVALLTAADLNSSLVYNYVKSSTGSGALVVGNSEETIGDVTGKPLTIGSNDAAVAISFVATGSVVNGQKTYTLSTYDGVVAQANDGTLLVVKDGTGSTFTFSEYDAVGNGFGIQCGSYYYYIDGNGILSAAKEIPEEASSDFDTMSAYLFTITDALGDYQTKASEEERTGLKSGWEFNEAPAEDPGTRGTYNGTAMTMKENSETKMIEGWRMSRWRAFSRVNQETVKNSDGTDATCLVLSSAATYDSWDGQTTGIVNDYTAAPALRMDAGKEEPFYARDPNPRDSTWAFDINPGMNRYFAIKMKGSDLKKFGSFTFFNVKKSIAISDKNIAGKKGDVVYFDLLNSGFSVGKQLFSSIFFSPEGFTHAGDKLYIDWVRFYNTVDDIPEESFAEDVAPTGIKSIQNPGTNGQNAVKVYNINGTFAGNSTNNLQPGVYVVKQGGKAKKVIIR